MYLLKFLFIVITVLWFIKQIIRLLLPYLLQNLAKKVQNQATRHHQGKTTQQPDDKVRVDYVPPSKSKTNSVGDFVDYEEVK